jgi:hypothetical protein
LHPFGSRDVGGGGSIAAEHAYDIHALARNLREEQAKNGRQLVSLSPKKLVVSKRDLGIDSPDPERQQ